MGRHTQHTIWIIFDTQLYFITTILFWKLKFSESCLSWFLWLLNLALSFLEPFLGHMLFKFIRGSPDPASGISLAALHISSCMQLTERGRGKASSPHAATGSSRHTGPAFRTSSIFPSSLPLPPRERKKEKEKGKGVRKTLGFESFEGGNTQQTQLIKHQTDRFPTLRFNPEVFSLESWELCYGQHCLWPAP